MAKTSHRLLAVAATAIALAMLTGCSSRVTSGLVTSKDFKAAHSKAEQECSGYGYVTEMGFTLDSSGNLAPGLVTNYKCLGYQEVIREIPDTYTLVLEGSEDSRGSSYTVPKAVFDGARVGYFYDSETGELKAR